MIEHRLNIDSSSTIVDNDARIAAIDTCKSFCVTAPAGSGKTELLTQRFLALLAHVEKPEQVLALTFTRKAAAEMRERIVSALQKACDGAEPESEHQRRTYKLAQQAMEASKRLDWNLLLYPARLKIQTLDSLCHSIVREQPLFSGAGGRLQAVDDAEGLYTEAINALLDELGKNSAIDAPLKSLLLFCDNNQEQLKNLFLEMLPFRDQWLGHATVFNQASDRELLLQNVLDKRVRLALKSCHQRIKPFESALVEVANFAANNFASGLCEQTDKNKEIVTLSGITALPDRDKASFPQWQGLVQLLIKDDGLPRKALNKNQGFPAQSAFKDKGEKESAKKNKESLVDVCDALAKDEDALRSLQTVAMLPLGGYQADQLEILDAMVQCLIRLVAHLTVVFQQRGECDHLEITSAALQSLNGQGTFPGLDVESGIAYRWSQKFWHILVDEFQDTSVSQYELLHSLTSDWHGFNVDNSDRQKTLFIVGDGMQSIYSFRAAKVGLFIKARESGVGDLELQNLTLQQNFRSKAGIIDWVNRHFVNAFPATSEINSGAVPYSESIPLVDQQADTPEPETRSKSENEESAVQALWFADDVDVSAEGVAEANYIANEIHELQRRKPNASIAILVRARSHLDKILQELEGNDIEWEGVDIDPLSTRESIMDCMTLTAALMDPVDDLAWYSLLRSPLCGVRLPDLQQISDAISSSPELTSVPDLLLNEAVLTSLIFSDELEARRIILFANQVRVIQQLRSTTSLRAWLEDAWFTLKGELASRYAFSGDESHAVIDYFDLVENLSQDAEAKGEMLQFSRIQKAVERLYAASGASSLNHSTAIDDETSAAQRIPAVKVMTIHKSKGLEFDAVFLPALQKSPAANKKPLLISHDYLFDDGSSGLLLYPRDKRAMLDAENRNNSGTLFEHLRQERNYAQSLESTRLLYVAATRAKNTLYLTASLNVSDAGDDVKSPARNSLLAKLWPTLSPHVSSESQVIFAQSSPVADPDTGIATANRDASKHALLKRLTNSAFHEHPSSISESLSYQDGRAADLIDNIDISSMKGVNGTDNNEPADTVQVAIGVCCHELLQLLEEQGLEYWQSVDLYTLKDSWKQRLYELGVVDERLEDSVAVVLKVMHTVTTSSRGQWLFDSSHCESAAEWRLFNPWSEGSQNDSDISSLSIVDRSFIDSEGVRWIIDYKITEPQGDESVEQFSCRMQQAYRNQLSRYARLIQHYDKESVNNQKTVVVKTQCALYFPLIDHLHTVSV